jgi:outer membrane protein assembly factor BamA
VRYVITEGTQQYIRQVFVSGAEHTRPYVIDRELTIAPNQPLSQLDMLETQKKLYDLGIFSEVDVAIQNPDGSLPDKNVLVQVEEARRYTFTYGFGFEAQTGDTGNVCLNSTNNGGQTITCNPQGRTGASPRFSFDVTRINFLGRDHTLLLKSVIGRLQQRGLISYEAPHWFNNADKTLTFDAFYDKTQDVNTFTAERLEGSTQVKHVVNRGTTLLYRFTYRRVSVDTTTLQVSADQIPLLSKPVRVGFPGITFIRDTRDNPITSSRGTYTTAELDVASRIFGSQSSFTKAVVQNSTYYQLNKNAKADRRWVLARSTQIGIEEPFGSPDQAFLPLPERFYTGGANSNRAFAINQAGPRDLQTGFPIGGGAVFVNNIELRTPPIDLPFIQDNLSAVFFHDMGNVFDTSHDMFHSFFKVRQNNIATCLDVNNPNAGCDFNYMAHALGTGLRYKTPIGPVRFDMGYTLNPTIFPVRTTTPPHAESLKHLNFVISIGQTF